MQGGDALFVNGGGAALTLACGGGLAFFTKTVERESRMKMAELEARTGVNRETIRVYLRKELIPAPVRPFRNSAVYGEEHVQAVLAVRTLQQENRLSLSQISAIITGQGAGSPSQIGANSFAHLEQLVAARIGLSERFVPVASLVSRFSHFREDARALASVGIVRIIYVDDDEMLSLTDVELVSIWGNMRAKGFGESLDFKPEMLSYYVEAAEFVASREARTFIDRTKGAIDEETAAAMLEHALPQMLNFFGLLRMKAFMRNINADSLSDYGADEPDGSAAHKPATRRKAPVRR